MMKVIELFSGLGSQTQALKNIDMPHEVVAISEIDKYAIKSYEALHGKVNNLGDITKIQELPQADLWTYSFPCVDCSIAGKMAGLTKGSGTRSGLLWEVERLLLKAKENGTLPKYLLLENVKNLIGKRFKADFDSWLLFLSNIGYANYYKVLNAKHYGIPQNRERVFCVSILGEHKPYKFPEPFPLELRLKDMLEEDVPEKYYISNARVKTIVNSNYHQRRDSVLSENSIVPTLCSRDWREPKCVVLGEITNEKFSKMIEQHRRIYNENGIAPTLCTCSGGNTHPKIAAMRGRNPNKPNDRTAGIVTEQRLEVGGDISNTLTTVQKDNLVICEKRYDEGMRFFKDDCCGSLGTIDLCGAKRVVEEYLDDENFRVRKLTPKECLRLMGWNDEQISKISNVPTSNTQMYRQAGNGVVLQVLEAIFKSLFLGENE